MKYIFDLHKTMLDNHLILVYEGEFNQEITKSVLAMAERNMDSSGEESSVKRKVFNVMVECLQNVVKHAEEVSNKHAAVFMVGKSDKEYIVISGNSISNENIDGLKGKIDQINALDKDGLKELYKSIIKNTEISDKGGAGLGFVDMARKSGKKLDYEFVELGDGSSFFCLRSSIERL
ncbi:MAG TPA: SiaB family protein kinase [Fulvivirga sp.]|nr:SiaB family protein kinase [Fulvivirga sp.]